MVMVRVKQTTFATDTANRTGYRKGPEFDLDGKQIADGNVFDLKDGAVLNQEVFDRVKVEESPYPGPNGQPMRRITAIEPVMCGDIEALEIQELGGEWFALSYYDENRTLHRIAKTAADAKAKRDAEKQPAAKGGAPERAESRATVRA